MGKNLEGFKTLKKTQKHQKKNTTNSKTIPEIHTEPAHLQKNFKDLELLIIPTNVEHRKKQFVAATALSKRGFGSLLGLC